jgi:hypothetical protein
MAGPPPRGQLRPSFDAASAASERRTSAATEEEHWTWSSQSLSAFQQSSGTTTGRMSSNKPAPVLDAKKSRVS